MFGNPDILIDVFKHSDSTAIAIKLIISSNPAVAVYWQMDLSWTSALNNLRLILQPYPFYHRIKRWLTVFPIPGLHRWFSKLMDYVNQFRAPPLNGKMVA
ncbi:MAG: hypothetical protein ACFE0I_16860 [Elainellaceae cyanobacterium]